jgi:hypothetical protein
MHVSRVSWQFVLAGALALAGCYKPQFASDPDAGVGFRCHASDNPPCPAGLVCCAEGKCGDELLNSSQPNAEGWCVTPPPPVDMTTTALTFWPFGTKTEYYKGEVMPIPLSGFDENNEWRCKRDDDNMSPAPSIARMLEPNDWPEKAIGLKNPLEADLPPSTLGSAYEICPDKSAPTVPDVDVFRFRVQTPSKIIAEIRYRAVNGDLDFAIFRVDTDTETGMKKPVVVAKDLSPVDNGCIEIPTLMPGTYYIVVRGTTTPEMPGVYTMNTYNIRVFPVVSTPYTCAKKGDGGT